MVSKPETTYKEVKSLHKEHSKLILSFRDWLIDDEDSSERNACNYLRILILFSKHLGRKNISKISKEDVIEFLDQRKKSIDADPEKKWQRTWNDYLARLVGFYRFVHNRNNLDDREDWKTPEPFCNIKKKKNKRDSSYSPNDVWNQDELLLAIKYCDDIRDKALFSMGWDMAARNHELTKIKLKDIIMKEKYAEVSTSWDTKTGIRTNPIIVGFPYLRDLLNNHPFANDPNAFLFISKVSSRPLKPDSLWRIADTLKKKIATMIEDVKIKGDDREKLIKLLQKPWNPYLMGRHSSITEKTDMLKDHQLIQYAGWTPNTTRRKTYIHRKGKQVINPLLQEHGIIQKEEPKTIRRECAKCNFINTVESTICSQCSFVLNTAAWQDLKIDEKQKEKDVSLTMQSIMKQLEKQESKTVALEQKLKDAQRQLERSVHSTDNLDEAEIKLAKKLIVKHGLS